MKLIESRSKTKMIMENIELNQKGIKVVLN
jgi:hypothetical protein